MTHGTIFIADQDTGRGWWLKTYHDGHPTAAFEQLCTLPKWYVRRGILEAWRLKNVNKEREILDGIGSLGSFVPYVCESVGVLKEFPSKESAANFFAEEWRRNFGVNIIHCDAAFVAALMITREFDRWHPVREEDLDKALGEEAEINVYCHAKDGYYRVVPGLEFQKLAQDENEVECWNITIPVQPTVVQFADDIFEGFKEICAHQFRYKENHDSSNKATSCVQESQHPSGADLGDTC